MVSYSDYYSVMARAISDLPGKTEEARGAVYELARIALQKGLSGSDPPISETRLAIERFALEAAIQRVETRFSDTRGLSFIATVMQIVRSVREKLNNKIAIIRGGSLKAAIIAGLAQGLEFFQRTQLTAPCRCIYRIFGERRWIAKYPQIRIAIRLSVAALVGIVGGIFLHWIFPENN